MNGALPAPRQQYLNAAHNMLHFAGFRRHGGKTQAPRTSKDNMAFIYTHPNTKAEVWVASGMSWSVKTLGASLSGLGTAQLRDIGGSMKLSDLSDMLKHNAVGLAA